MYTVEGDNVDEYDKFIKTDGLLPPKITELTGITDKLIQERGVDERDIAEDLKDKLSQNTLMIAHNAQFDLSFVYHLLKRHFPGEADEIVENVDWIDTMTVLKDRKDFPHKLIDAVEHYNLEKVNFHRAIDDTKALYRVYNKLADERDDLMEYKNIFGYNPKWGVSGEKFKFIEYKCQPYHNRGCLPQDKILPRM